MAFVAIDKDTGERIDITRINNPKSVLKSGQCLCQLCHQPLIVRDGEIVSAHFSHYSECGDSDWLKHPESPLHRAGKRYVASKIVEQWAEYRTAQIEYEVRVPEVRRIADVMAIFPNGWRVAHEVQLASITQAELEARSNDYARAGISVVWWLGQAANTRDNRLWCDNRFGFSFDFLIETKKGDQPPAGMVASRSAYP